VAGEPVQDEDFVEQAVLEEAVIQSLDEGRYIIL